MYAIGILGNSPRRIFMKKSILSVLLALVLALSCVTLFGCESETNENETIGTVGTTLTLWLPAAAGTEVDDEAVINVENAINEFTQKNFTTAVKLKVFPADEYDSIVLSKLYQIKEAEDAAAAAEAAARRANREKKNGKNTETETETETDAADSVVEFETTDASKYILPDDENGKKVYDYEYEHAYMNASIFASYPAVESNQFDIFLVHGFEEFELLYNDFLLTELTNNVSSYVNSAFMKGAVYDGTLSVIPNNRPAGEASAMLINKSVCEQLFYDPERFDSVEKLFSYDSSGISFIEDVKNSLPDVIPVAGNYKATNIHYFSNTDDSTFSLLAALVSPDVDRWDSFGMDNVFRNGNFVNSYRLNKRIREIIRPVDFDGAENFAVGFFNGSFEELQKYKDDYKIVTLQNPKLSREEVFKSAFAVSSYSKNPERALQIIDAINTNTELRTILQYGQEGVHWRYDVENTDVIHVMSDKYKMDMTETGNCFITYPGDGRPISDWDAAKEFNVNLFLPYTYGFSSVSKTTAELVDDLTKRSAEMYERIEAMSYAEFNENFDKLRDEVDNLESYQKLSHIFGVNPAQDENFIEDESLPVLFLDYVNLRGW